MIANLLTAVGSVITEFVDVLADGLTGVSRLFFETDATSGALNLTFLGSVSIIAVGAGLVWLVYRLIKGAIRGIGR